MDSFFSACCAHLNASSRALAMPSVCSRSMWMSGMRRLLVLEEGLAFGLGQVGQPPGFRIETRPVAADGGEQGLEARHQLVVRGQRAERRVVGLRDPLVGEADARRIE